MTLILESSWSPYAWVPNDKNETSHQNKTTIVVDKQGLPINKKGSTLISTFDMSEVSIPIPELRRFPILPFYFDFFLFLILFFYFWSFSFFKFLFKLTCEEISANFFAEKNIRSLCANNQLYNSIYGLSQLKFVGPSVK